MCPSSHRGGESQVQHLKSGVGDELPSLDPPKILSFFLQECSTEKWHIVMYISFLFWQIYNTVCVLPVSSSYDKVSQYGVFLDKIQAAIIYSLKKRTMRVWARKAKFWEQYCNTVRGAISSGVCSSRRWGCCASLPLTLSPICTTISGSEI